MSTYILAFAVLDGFAKERWLTSTTRTPVEVSMFASVPDLHAQAGFGLNVTVRALSFFETYFDIPFPLQKTGEKRDYTFVDFHYCLRYGQKQLLLLVDLKTTNFLKNIWPFRLNNLS